MAKDPQLEYPVHSNTRAPADTFRILFLDNPDQIERLKETVKDVGYVVLGATTILQAVAFLEGKDHVDVIVCAAHLEADSVFVFLQQVRASALHKDSMFLMLSLEAGTTGTRLDRSAARAGIALGADAYVVMPVFDAGELVAQIRALQPDVPMLQQSTSPEEKRAAQ